MEQNAIGINWKSKSLFPLIHKQRILNKEIKYNKWSENVSLTVLIINVFNKQEGKTTWRHSVWESQAREFKTMREDVEFEL